MIGNFFSAILNLLGGFYPIGNRISDAIGFFLGLIIVHKAFYYIIGMFYTRKFKPAKNKHKYGIVIAARNEKYVIGNLLDSINKQDYPTSLLTTFVVADNCTDNTAEIARKHGAVVYERFDDAHRTKGYALEFLFERIEEDYGVDSFEGFFVFDADNLLKTNYISKMNDAFDSGEKIITSYRNTKNIDENWIAANYALHWIRSIRTNHRARSVLHLATNIQGTGFLFASEIVSNGWHYTSLTEDRALTADAVAHGYEITYQDEAEFFDEQPVNLKIALRQRLRWAKGLLQAFVESGPHLFMNIIFGKKYLKVKWKMEYSKKKNKWLDLVESIRHRFAAFDTLEQLIPIVFINLCRWLFVSVIFYSCFSYKEGITNMALFSGWSWFAKFLRGTFPIYINMEAGLSALFISLIVTIIVRIVYRISSYLTQTLQAVYLFIVEDARIKKISLKKKLLYILTWPTFDIIGRYATYFALFMKVEWKPIPHESKITIDDLNGGK